LTEKQRPEVFIRQASGLVKVASAKDLLMFNMMWTGGLGGWIVFLYAWKGAYAPGANLPIAMLITTGLIATASATYALFAAAMPRAGGDYIYVSRSLHPALGFMSNFSMAAWTTYWNGWAFFYFGNMGLYVLFGVWGVMTQNQGLMGLSQLMLNPIVDIAIGLVLQVLFFIPLLTGTKRSFQLNNAGFFLGLVGFVVGLGLVVSTNQASFLALFNQVMAPSTGIQNSAQHVIDTARGLGFDPNPGFSWSQTLLLVPIAFGYVQSCMGSSYVGGEVKAAKRNQIIGLVMGSVLMGVGLTAYWVMTQHLVGDELFNSMAYLWTTNSTAYALPVDAYYINLILILARSLPVYLIVIAGFLAWGWIYVAGGTFTVARMEFAWAFDRVMPAKLGDVSPRWNTPVFALIVSEIASTAWLLAFALYLQYTPFFFVSSIFAMTVVIFLVGLAAIVFPYRMKGVYERSPVRYKILGVPLITILGIIVTVYTLILSYLYLTVDAFGANAPVSLETVVGFWIAGLVIYYTSYVINKRRGVDLRLAFKELPPE
jgi:amino acid transporter